MSAHVIRPVVAADLPALRAVFRQTIHALMQQHGRADDIDHVCPLVPAEWEHVLATDPDLHWVAELNGAPAGYVSSILRDSAWFLSGFWVLPELQGGGIGADLLRRVRDAADARGATTHGVYSSATLSAQALYMRQGMVARTPLYVLTAPCDRAAARALTGAPLLGGAVRPVDASEDIVAALSSIDRVVRGTGRADDHRYWLARPTRVCLVLEESGAIVGYAYASSGGRIGPMAAVSPTYLRPLAGAAIHVATNRSASADDAEVVIGVPGLNVTLLRILFDCGFRIEHAGVWMTDAEIGQMDRYAISGAILF